MEGDKRTMTETARARASQTTRETERGDEDDSYPKRRWRGLRRQVEAPSGTWC